jgi:hypothetical protein
MWKRRRIRTSKKKYSYLIAFILIINQYPLVNGQVQDSLHSRKLIYRSIVPTVFIGAGILLNGSQIEQDLQQNLRSWVGDDFSSDIDDYFQYAPIAELYLADIFGVKSKNHWFDQTKYLLISNLITAGITQGLKYITLKPRPNGAPYAFPSGHTSFAFNNATVLFNEFSETAPVFAYSGYAFAATTGIFRMLNNKHWLSDVLVGAGIGMLVTELVYYFEPLKSFNPFLKSDAISLIPQITGQTYGFYFSYDL